MGSTIVAFISFGILLLWDKVLSKKSRFFQLIQGPLVAVVVGILYTRLTLGNNTLGLPKKTWLMSLKVRI